MYSVRAVLCLILSALTGPKSVTTQLKISSTAAKLSHKIKVYSKTPRDTWKFLSISGQELVGPAAVLQRYSSTGKWNLRRKKGRILQAMDITHEKVDISITQN